MTAPPTTARLNEKDLHDAVYGDGPLAFAWDDKSHRLLIDAAQEIGRLQAALKEIAALQTDRCPGETMAEAYAYLQFLARAALS